MGFNGTQLTMHPINSIFNLIKIICVYMISSVYDIHYNIEPAIVNYNRFILKYLPM